MVEIGSGTKRQVEDVHLSRYVCYLIVQNADPSKPVIANGQTYFAIPAPSEAVRIFGVVAVDQHRIHHRLKFGDRQGVVDRPLPGRRADQAQ